MKQKISIMFFVTVLFLSVSCQKRDHSKMTMIRIDGSSTVYPIMEAMAEEFQKVNPTVRISVGVSGTGGGMKRFTVGDLEIVGASRSMKDSEIAKAKEHGIEFYEIPLAYDGLVLVTHPKNEGVNSLTTEELKRLWQSDSAVTTWKDLRSNLPATEVKFFGPGPDSGTFDYFSEAIVGKERSLRKDYNASEDDNVLVHGVQGELGSLGFFGFSYYLENKDKLKLISVDHGNGPVFPSNKTIMDGTYNPLSRPLYIYIEAKAMERKEVRAFLEFIWTKASEYLPEVGYLPVQDAIYQLTKERVDRKLKGALSMMTGLKGKKLLDIYAKP